MYIFRAGLGADKNNLLTFLGLLFSFIGSQDDFTGGTTRPSGQALGQRLMRTLYFRIYHGMEKFVQLRGLKAFQGGRLVNQTFLEHLNSHAQGGNTIALAHAGLEHIQDSILDGKLYILHVGVVFFETITVGD
jgi:hypothetical protein